MKLLTTQHRRLAQIASLFVGLWGAGAISCNIPVLESPECRAAKNSIREFYSIHFGSDMHPSAEGLELRKNYLTPELATAIAGSTNDQSDYFTQTTGDYPRAFRVGSCKSEDNNKAEVEVLIFWKDDVRSEQRSINVEAIRIDDRWLINKVSKN